MSILITGASGFLGNYLKQGVTQDYITLGRAESNDIVGDLSGEIPALPPVHMVIHNAGKAHMIPKTKAEIQSFFDVNVRGTENLLKAIQKSGKLPKSFVFISSVAVYGLDSGDNITEDTPLLGTTPYAKSKILAEQLVLDWAKENQVNAVILRLPLVVGERKPPGNLGAMIDAIQKGTYFRLGPGNAKKSMVLAVDVANLIPGLMDENGIFNLTDGYGPSISELDTHIAFRYGKKVRQVPINLIKPFAKIGDYLPFLPINSYRLEKLTSHLIFSDAKAVDQLGWKPRTVLGNFLK